MPRSVRVPNTTTTDNTIEYNPNNSGSNNLAASITNIKPPILFKRDLKTLYPTFLMSRSLKDTSSI